MVLVGVLALPVVSHAAGSSMCLTVGGLLDILCRISELLAAIIPILVALGIVYFVYGVVMYMIADSEEAKTKGRDSIIAGIIGLAVIVSVWGLVKLVVDTFAIDPTVPPQQSFKNLLPK